MNMMKEPRVLLSFFFLGQIDWVYSGVTQFSVLDLFRNLQALFLCPYFVTGMQKY